MAVTLSLSVSESSVNQANNTSVVTATLKAKATYGSWNANKRSGYITIDGTKYTFSHNFNSGHATTNTTTLATKSKTITHNADGSKSIKVKGWYSTDVSSGDISTSKTVTLTTIQRQFAVTYNANGGTGAPSGQTKVYNTNLTLSSVTPTRGGYIFKGWSTSATGAVSYNPGSIYTGNSPLALYAVWEAVTYTLSFNANGGSNPPSPISKPHDIDVAIPSTIPTRYHYIFKGWSTTSTGALEYLPGSIFKLNGNNTLYAVWEYSYAVPTLKINSAYRTNTSSGTSEVPTGEYIYVSVSWTIDTDHTPVTITAKCNSTNLVPETSPSGSSGTVVYRLPSGVTLGKAAVGNISITVKDSSGREDSSVSDTAFIGVSVSPIRLKKDCVEFGKGIWIGEELKVGGNGYHDPNSVNVLDIIFPEGSIIENSNTSYDPNGILPGTWTKSGTKWERVD